MPTLGDITSLVNKLLGNFQMHRHTGIDSLAISYADLKDKRDSTTVVLAGTVPQTASNYGVFYTFPAPATIINISEVHSTAGSDASAVTVNVERLTGTQASGSGSHLLSTAFNLKATANTVQNGTVTASSNVNAGDRLGLVLSGTPTSVTDVVIVVETSPL